MAGKTSPRRVTRLKRQQRVRARVKGTGEQPRLCVFRSNRHMYAQVINDREGATLVAASSLSSELTAAEERKVGKDLAFAVGMLVAKKALEKGLEKVVFDRNGFIYRKNGLIATLAAGARKGGLKF